MSDRLIDRWVSGSASAEDRAELVELLEKDPVLVDRLFRAAERECDLAEMFRGLTTISTTSPTPVRASRPRRTPNTTWWLPFVSGLAAALVVAVVVVQLTNQRRSEVLALPLVEANKVIVPVAPITKVSLTPVIDATPLDPVTAPVALSDHSADHTALEQFVADLPNDTTDVPLSHRPPAGATNSAASKPPAAMQVAKREKPVVEVGQGMDRLDGDLKDAEGTLVMRYSLRAPHVLPSHPELGLVLCFHGAGGNEQWLADPILTALRSQGEVPMVIAALKSKGPSWQPADESNVLAFIDWAKRTYPIDARRIVIQGVSNGGWMVSHFGSRHPELIAGVVTVCGGNGFEAPVKRPSNAAETGFEYYVIHGTADEEVNVKNARGITTTLRNNGFRYVYRELPGIGHDVFSDEETRRDFAGWMTRLRHKTMPLPDEDRKALTAFANRDDAERLLLSDDGSHTLVRIGGLPAEKILARALRAKNPQVRATAAHLFSQTATMPGATTLLAGLLEDKDAGVRHAVIASLVRAANWNDQEAMIALCRFAGAKANTPGERLDVVRTLTSAIAFRCSPGRENQLVYELLVYLLDDEDVSLRAAAISALPHVEPERFAYDPTAANAERREPQRQWRRWYLELFTPPDEKTEPRK